MDVNGKTDYRLDDTLPASETVLWSSLKTSKFFWKNTLTSGNNLAQVTPDNTTTILTIPLTGVFMLCFQGTFTANYSVWLNVNSKTELSGIIQTSVINGFNAGHLVRDFVKGDKVLFGTNQSNVQLQVYQL
jgi:hypothetical protein